jgi:hypothetical protein
VISRTRIFQLVAFTAVLAATPLAAVHYQAAMRDPDIWWHMRVGEMIARGQGFPHTAVFSRFSQTNTWSAYSWLFELAVAQLYRWFSIQALPTFVFVMQVAIGTALLWSATLVTGSPWKGVLLTGAALAASFYTLSPRPVLITVLLFTLEMAIIFLALRERRVRYLHWLPPLFCVWANFHIQFINGLLVLGLLCGCELVQEFASRKFRVAAAELPWRSLALVFAACVAATLVSPYSWRLYEIVWGYASRGAQWNQIVELAAPSFRRPAHFIELLLAASAAFALGVRRSRSLFRITLLLFAAVVSFHASRDAWMVSIVSIFLCGEAMRNPAAAEEPKSERIAMLATTSAMALAICVMAQARAGYSTAALIGELDRMYPVRAASYLAETRPPGPLYNSMNWGGYLIYNLREYPVAVDGRSDAYAGDLGAALKVEEGMPGWKQEPTFASSNVVLVERNLPLAGLLMRDQDFKLVYQDHLAMVFLRTRR